MATIYRATRTQVVSPKISSPKGIAIDTDNGHILVCDYDNHRLVLYDKGFREITTQTKMGLDALGSPSGACYYDGLFYVTDASRHVLARFRARDLAYKDRFGTQNISGGTNSTLNTPRDVCTDKANLYIADAGNNRLMKITLSNLSYSAQDSNINGALSNPSGICYHKVGHDEYLFISDTDNNRVLKCDIDFTYRLQNNTNVTAPLHLKVINDFVHVCHSNEIEVLKVIDLTTQTSLTDSLSTPTGIDALEDSFIVSDTGNNQVEVWRAYQPRDALAPSSTPVFGGKPFRNPFLTFGDSLIPGSTFNNWVDNINNNYGLGWEEELPADLRMVDGFRFGIDTFGSPWGRRVKSKWWVEETGVTNTWTEE